MEKFKENLDVSFINKYFDKSYKQTKLDAQFIRRSWMQKNIYSKSVLKIMSNYFLRLWI
jgi:hypothetical protein